MNRRRLFVAVSLLLAFSAGAGELAPALGPQVGDCAVFREGGAGILLKAPTYWLQGTIAAISRERRLAGPCPRTGKPLAASVRDDWVRAAAATPCVEPGTDPREVEVTRIGLRVDDWETPWSHSHGASAWLFRGYFLDQLLKKGEVIEMDASWLESCEARR